MWQRAEVQSLLHDKPLWVLIADLLSAEDDSLKVFPSAETGAKVATLSTFETSVPSETLMPKLPMNFPTEAEQLRRRVAMEKHLTPTQRIHALCDALDAAETLSRSGTQREHQLAFHRRLEQEWQRTMKGFISKYCRA